MKAATESVLMDKRESKMKGLYTRARDASGSRGRDHDTITTKR